MKNYLKIGLYVAAIAVWSIVLIGTIVPDMVSSRSTIEVVVGIALAIVWAFVTFRWVLILVEKVKNL